MSETEKDNRGPVNVIACSLALSGFAIAAVAGIATANPALITLTRATIALIVCYVLGMLVGEVGTYVVRDHLRSYQEENPIIDPEAILAQEAEATQRALDEENAEAVQPT